ncbi:uncharacterized protein N7484_002902 [Penicillium longicatenatum]|uniref:uncharacterized protein n=1 Tax=Penicillium longicatenatum TaxID=1561947 RepID=UPI0025494151|nr:uncharacterized protein N7484_002902 [Penicillium longicatenatum]KAJ5649179.1 hypothetical protein N7484_002902 [Penicillium longicatenatum]
MVTGIEATGLVLAILPLIINQLDSCVQGVETMKSFRTKRYRRYLDERAAILGGQHAILLNCLETILEDIVPEDQISRLLADTQDLLWADPTLQKDLQQRLGRGYTPFCDIMSQVSHILEELANKMGLQLNNSKVEDQTDVDPDPVQMKYSPQSAETDPDSYPEGGWNAWSVVLGSWMASFSTIGMMNSLGIFQTYLEEHHLREYSSGKIGCILGVYSFHAFFCGIQVGPIFDAKGPRILVACGGIGTVLFMILLGFCTRYWHFMLVFGVLGGVSVSLAFNPAISIVAHYFRRRRGLATGVASSGASCGGVV